MDEKVRKASGPRFHCRFPNERSESATCGISPAAMPEKRQRRRGSSWQWRAKRFPIADRALDRGVNAPASAQSASSMAQTAATSACTAAASALSRLGVWLESRVRGALCASVGALRGMAGGFRASGKAKSRSKAALQVVRGAGSAGYGVAGDVAAGTCDVAAAVGAGVAARVLLKRLDRSLRRASSPWFLPATFNSA